MYESAIKKNIVRRGIISDVSRYVRFAEALSCWFALSRSFLSSSRRKFNARLRTHTYTHTLRQIFFIGTRTKRRTVIADIAYSTATYMHSQFFPFAIGRGRGGWKKPRCVARYTHWKTRARAPQRHLSQR